MVEAETTATSVVEAAVDTTIAMTAMTETLAALAMHPQLPPMVIQLLLGNLMVAATLMRDTPVESSDC
jgi:hypothetical protein